MAAIRQMEPKILPGLFKELYISTNKSDGLTRIGIYDQGYEVFDVEELVQIRAHLNSIILTLKFPKSTGVKGLPF